MPLEDTRADPSPQDAGRRGTPVWVPHGAPEAPLNAPGAHEALTPATHRPVPHGPVPSAPVPPPPHPGAAVAASASQAPRPAAAPRRGRRAVRVLAVLLVLVVLVAGGLVTYLWRTTDAWRSTSGDWEHLARQAATDLATTRADLDTARDDLAETREQLTTAQARITELADEKAQLGDDSAAQQQLADYQARVSQAAGQVATALATCIDSQQQLIGYLLDAEQYEPADLERFRTDVDGLCAQATAANAQLQEELEP